MGGPKDGVRKMAKRHKMPQRGSQRHFTKHAMRAHPKNTVANPMRGGIRL